MEELFDKIKDALRYYLTAREAFDTSSASARDALRDLLATEGIDVLARWLALALGLLERYDRNRRETPESIVKLFDDSIHSEPTGWAFTVLQLLAYSPPPTEADIKCQISPEHARALILQEILGLFPSAKTFEEHEEFRNLRQIQMDLELKTIQLHIYDSASCGKKDLKQ